MEENNRVKSLVVAFLIVIALYFVVWFFAVNVIISNVADQKEIFKNDTFTPRTEYIVVQGKKEVQRSNKVILNDKFVGKVDKDGSVVAISKNGQAYNVVNGVVLASDMVISVNDETYSVYRVNDPEKSVSSN